jgi:hypothetical protein
LWSAQIEVVEQNGDAIRQADSPPVAAGLPGGAVAAAGAALQSGGIAELRAWFLQVVESTSWYTKSWQKR